jgi:SPP1 gp7 family putative phage head morphogenesis protein
MRQTLYRREVKRARRQIERSMTRAVYRELSIFWRKIYPRVRKISYQKPVSKTVRRSALRKASFLTDTHLWEMFETRLREHLLSELVAGAVTLEAIRRAAHEENGITIDPQAVIAAHRAEIADEVHGISTRTRRKVGRIVSNWYQKPGKTLDDLVDDLHPFFDERRAQMIAITETTALNSRVIAAEMDALGTDDWIWDTSRDEIVCRNCREKHGRTFHRNDPMPPEGSHPGCRCGAIPKPKID